MRRSLPYEVLATVMALLGALLLVKVFVPLLNPGLYQVRSGRAGEPVGYYLVWAPIPLIILGFAWYLNIKGQRLKREDEESDKKRVA
jgi:hypothetical protein